MGTELEPAIQQLSQTSPLVASIISIITGIYAVEKVMKVLRNRGSTGPSEIERQTLEAINSTRQEILVSRELLDARYASLEKNFDRLERRLDDKR